MKRSHVFSLAGVAVAMLSPTPVTAQTQYTFTRIVDGVSFGTNVAINDAGQVTFAAILSSGNGVFVGNGGPITTVADTTNGFRFFGFSSIDGRGQVTFFANRNDGSAGIFAGPQGATTLIDNSGRVLGFRGDPHSSASGQFMTIHAALRNRGQEIFVSNGTNLTSIADTTGRFSAFDIDPRVNSAGQVAFEGFLRSGESGIFVGSGGTQTTIADTSGKFQDFTGLPSINDQGEVAFGADLKSGEEGIFVGSGGTVRTLVDGSGSFDGGFSFGNPILNNAGQVAFRGTLKPDANGKTIDGLFVGPDAIRDRVFLVGDPLDGSTIANMTVFGDYFNNVGQLAFFAELADGRTGIYRATPVPEPGSILLLLSIVTVGSLLRRRKRGE